MDPNSKAPAVGFCLPPTEYRFIKGKSGNPAGRPKKKPLLHEAIERELNRTITVTENGRRETSTKVQVIAKQMTNGAVKGEFKWAKLLTELLEKKNRMDTLLEVGSAAGPGEAFAVGSPEQLRARLKELMDKSGYVHRDSLVQEPSQEILPPLKEEE